ncbi:MAG TPA: tetratricopeptide repeat protein [Nevskiaceae bacterium]|nr:tetratricopeptide repeat protein [Nevskiaceae bacterium]
MSTRIGLACLALALVLGGCASSSGQRERVTSYPPPRPQASLPPSTAPGSPLPNTPSGPVAPQPIVPESAPLPSYPRIAEEISGQAVVALMRQARQKRDQNQLDRAAEDLERAIRIEPRNYFVWSMLAQIYLEQQNYDQAISVAGKSNSLARGNVYVELPNWKTISAARSAQGDSIGALQAQSKVDEIQRQIGG